MARGYPDYFGTPIFNSAGKILYQAALVGSIAPNASETLFLIETKAILLNGYFTCYVTGDDLSFNVGIRYDGKLVFYDGSLEICLRVGWNKNFIPVYIGDWLKFDKDGAERANVGLFQPISFETEYKLIVKNKTTVDMGIQGNIVYGDYIV